MSAESFSKEFVRHRDVPGFLIAVIGAVALYFDSLSKLWIIVVIFLLLVVWMINILLESRLKLIKEYKSFMPLINKLLDGDKDIVFVSTKINVRGCWRYYFSEIESNLRKSGYDLDNDLNKIISNPYKLINTPHKLSLFLSHKELLDIQWKFNWLVEENHRLYQKFIEMLNNENISKNSFDFDKIKNKRKQLFDALKNSEDIEKRISNEAFMPLEEPKQ